MGSDDRVEDSAGLVCVLGDLEGVSVTMDEDGFGSVVADSHMSVSSEQQPHRCSWYMMTSGFTHMVSY